MQMALHCVKISTQQAPSGSAATALHSGLLLSAWPQNLGKLWGWRGGPVDVEAAPLAGLQGLAVELFSADFSLVQALLLEKDTCPLGLLHWVQESSQLCCSPLQLPCSWPEKCSLARPQDLQTCCRPRSADLQ